MIWVVIIGAGIVYSGIMLAVYSLLEWLKG
jgi:hypothetical protein